MLPSSYLSLTKFAVKYCLVVLALLLGFSNFVACGSQFYRVSLEDDVATHPGSDHANPESPSYGIHAQGGWRQVPIPFKFGKSMDPNHIEAIRKSIQTWENVIGIQLFRFDGIDSLDGDDFFDLYSSLKDQVNGKYLDRIWSKTGKNQSVLATTIWKSSDESGNVITDADIRFNAEFYTLGDAYEFDDTETLPGVDLWSLALHEVGHLLGLAHVEETIDSYSVMNPHLYIGAGMAFRIPSKGDIQRIQKIYGCQGSACDIDATLAALNHAAR